ncbi:MAG: oligosaccharide repeat unit polymerase [Spirochaetes bacterium]|nr:oligosaccharide repeat unit polymerase [Spirochaetota bacterium]
MKILSKQQFILFITSLFLSILIFYFFFINNLALVSILFHLLAIIFFFFIEDKIDLSNAFCLFSLYYLFFIIAAFYYYFTDFKDNPFVNGTIFNNDIKTLFIKSVFLSCFGYLSSLIGYKCFNKNTDHNLKDDKDRLDFNVLNFFIFIFTFIALINFIMNIFKYANGNILFYFKQVSIIPQKMDQDNGTTIGYNFAYIASYLLFYKIYIKKKKLNLILIFHILFCFILKISTARIMGSLIYLLSFIIIFYYINYSYKLTWKVMFIGFFLILLSLALYFYRYYSSLLVSGNINNINDFLNKMNLSDIPYFMISKGNLPNIPIIMKIVDSFGKDTSFLFGRTFFSSIYTLIPSEYRPINYQLSRIIKETWFFNVPGGSLPPTIIGEMYANFGHIGVIIGMFIFGSFIGISNRILLKNNNYLVLLIYVKISLIFIMFSPKNEFDNFPMFEILLIITTYFIIRTLSSLIRFVINKNELNIRSSLCKR